MKTSPALNLPTQIAVNALLRAIEAAGGRKATLEISDVR